MNDGNLATTAFASVDFPDPNVRQQISRLKKGLETTRNSACHKRKSAIIRISRPESCIQFNGKLRAYFGHHAILFFGLFLMGLFLMSVIKYIKL